MPVAPTRVGFWGFGRQNAFHYEQLCLLPGVEFGLVLNRDATARLPFHFAVTTNARDMATACPQLLFVECGPDVLPGDGEALGALNENGTIIVLDWPDRVESLFAGWPTLDFPRLDRVSFCARHRLEPGFATACAALNGGAIGPLRHLAYTLWQQSSSSPLVPHLSANPAAEASGSTTQHLVRHLLEVFDQLVLLAGESPMQMWAHGRRAGSANSLVGVTAVCRFGLGLTASVDIDLAAWAATDTGWLITGARGGYAQQTLYASAPDGEIQDLPLECVQVTPEEVYGPLLGFAEGRGPNPVELASLSHPCGLVREVLRQIELMP